jgi:hypothetical protein
VFALTSQGSPDARFRRALDTGNVLLVRAAAAELQRVELGDALRILGVFSQDSELYERAAVRWLGRFCLEAPNATVEDVQVAADELETLGEGVTGEVERLAVLCRRCGVQT